MSSSGGNPQPSGDEDDNNNNNTSGRRHRSCFVVPGFRHDKKNKRHPKKSGNSSSATSAADPSEPGDHIFSTSHNDRQRLLFKQSQQLQADWYEGQEEEQEKEEQEEEGGHSLLQFPSPQDRSHEARRRMEKVSSKKHAYDGEFEPAGKRGQEAQLLPPQKDITQSIPLRTFDTKRQQDLSALSLGGAASTTALLANKNNMSHEGEEDDDDDLSEFNFAQEPNPFAVNHHHTPSSNSTSMTPRNLKTSPATATTMASTPRTQQQQSQKSQWEQVEPTTGTTTDTSWVSSSAASSSQLKQQQQHLQQSKQQPWPYHNVPTVPSSHPPTEPRSVGSTSTDTSHQQMVQANQAEIASESNPISQQQQPQRNITRHSAPVDVDDSSFQDPMENIQGIHAMAMEHVAKGEYDMALQAFSQVLQVYLQQYGRANPLTAAAYHNLGTVHSKRAGLLLDHTLHQRHCREQALLCFQAAARSARDCPELGPNHPNVAVSLVRIGFLLLQSRQYVNAVITFQEALRIRTAHYGPTHALVANLYNNLGVCHMHLQEFVMGRKYLQQALDIQKQLLVEEQNNTTALLELADTLCNIGGLCLEWIRQQGPDARHALDAEQAFLEALEVRSKVLGDHHALTQQVRSLHDMVRSIPIPKTMASPATSPARSHHTSTTVSSHNLNNRSTNTTSSSLHSQSPRSTNRNGIIDNKTTNNHSFANSTTLTPPSPHSRGILTSPYGEHHAPSKGPETLAMPSLQQQQQQQQLNNQKPHGLEPAGKKIHPMPSFQMNNVDGNNTNPPKKTNDPSSSNNTKSPAMVHGMSARHGYQQQRSPLSSSLQREAEEESSARSVSHVRSPMSDVASSTVSSFALGSISTNNNKYYNNDSAKKITKRRQQDDKNTTAAAATTAATAGGYVDATEENCLLGPVNDDGQVSTVVSYAQSTTVSNSNASERVAYLLQAKALLEKHEDGNHKQQQQQQQQQRKNGSSSPTFSGRQERTTTTAHNVEIPQKEDFEEDGLAALGGTWPDPTTEERITPEVLQHPMQHLITIHNCAANYLRRGRYKEALHLFEMVLECQRSKNGPVHEDVGAALHNVGICQMRSGQYYKALQAFEEAVRVRKGALGRDHPQVAVSLVKVGITLLLLKRFEDSLWILREALTVRKNALGALHPSTARIYNNIGCVHVELNELKEARRSFEAALDIQRNKLVHEPQNGPVMFGAATTLQNLAYLYRKRGSGEKATMVLREALTLQEKAFGPNHPSVIAALDSLADACAESNRESQALGYYGQVLERLEEQNDDDEATTTGEQEAAVLYKMAKVHEQLNDSKSQIHKLHLAIKVLRTDNIHLSKSAQELEHQIQVEMRTARQGMEHQELEWV